MSAVFQVTEQDIERSSTLKQSDLGKWCFISSNTYEGFYDTKEEAEAVRDYVFKK